MEELSVEFRIAVEIAKFIFSIDVNVTEYNVSLGKKTIQLSESHLRSNMFLFLNAY